MIAKPISEEDQNPTSGNQSNATVDDVNQTTGVGGGGEKGDSAISLQPQPLESPGEGELPFSKGRCIALVATVTGASFLNVSCLTKW